MFNYVTNHFPKKKKLSENKAFLEVQSKVESQIKFVSVKDKEGEVQARLFFMPCICHKRLEIPLYPSLTVGCIYVAFISGEFDFGQTKEF